MAFNQPLINLKEKSELHYLVEKAAYYLFESAGRQDHVKNWNDSVTAVSVYPSRPSRDSIRLVTETDLHLELKRKAHEEFEYSTQTLKIPRAPDSQKREWIHAVESLAFRITEYYLDKFFLDD